MIRAAISSFAFLVKVRAKIVLGVTPRDMVSHAMRRPSTRVFPAPAPAAISSGTSAEEPQNSQYDIGRRMYSRDICCRPAK